MDTQIHKFVTYAYYHTIRCVCVRVQRNGRWSKKSENICTICIYVYGERCAENVKLLCSSNSSSSNSNNSRITTNSSTSSHIAASRVCVYFIHTHTHTHSHTRISRFLFIRHGNFNFSTLIYILWHFFSNLPIFG